MRAKEEAQLASYDLILRNCHLQYRRRYPMAAQFPLQLHHG